MKTFEQYHKEHPEVWKEFLNITLKTIDKGFSNYSAKGIFELIRWHKGGKIKDDGFKINNNYTPDYARMFMSLYPRYDGFFRMRTRK